MDLNIFRMKKLEEILSEMDITEMKVSSNTSGEITFISLEFTPREEEQHGRNVSKNGCREKE